MKEQINICQRNENGKLAVVDTKTLTVNLDETDMTLAVKYQGKQYTVKGTYHFQYIVLED